MTFPTCVVVFWLVVLCVHDLRDHRLPNGLTVPAGAASIAMGCADGHVAASIAVLSAPYLVAALVGACGGGDLKLAVGLGGLLADPVRAVLVVGGAAAVTVVVGVVRGARRSEAGVAHGPALAAAALVFGGVGVG